MRMNQLFALVLNNLATLLLLLHDTKQRGSMPGKATAIRAGDRLAKLVVELAVGLGLDAQEQYRCGRRIWGAERRIDVIITEPLSRRRLGVECKAQDNKGTAEEKIVATIQDMDAWPISGLLVFSGEGFSDKMKSFMIASGKATEFEDLESWLRLFFGLTLECSNVSPKRSARKERKES